MTAKPKQDKDEDKRRDEVLKRMLAMPPQTHQTKKPNTQKPPKKAKK